MKVGGMFENDDQKLERYERITDKIKKMVDNERKKLKMVRAHYSREISTKTELEYLLR
jgi:hypothetical protein